MIFVYDIDFLCQPHRRVKHSQTVYRIDPRVVVSESCSRDLWLRRGIVYILCTVIRSSPTVPLLCLYPSLSIRPSPSSLPHHVAVNSGEAKGPGLDAAQCRRGRLSQWIQVPICS